MNSMTIDWAEDCLRNVYVNAINMATKLRDVYVAVVPRAEQSMHM